MGEATRMLSPREELLPEQDPSGEESLEVEKIPSAWALQCKADLRERLEAGQAARGTPAYTPVAEDDTPTSSRPPEKKRSGWIVDLSICICVGASIAVALLAIQISSFARLAGSSHHEPGPSDDSCLDASAALARVRQIVGAHMRHGGATPAERKIGDTIVSGDFNASFIPEVFSVVLAGASLPDALHTGSVVTADDLNRLEECRLGLPFGSVRLEEHNITKDGIEIVQGDIAVSGRSDDLIGVKRMLSGQQWRGPAWKDGIVKYCFASSASERARTAWASAVERLRSQVPCLELREVSTANDDACVLMPSIIITGHADDGCWSYLGQVSGNEHLKHRSQTLNLGRGCESPGGAAHQLGHALGLPHEHLRPGRDEFLAVNVDAIRESEMEALSWVKEFEEGDDGYDILSLMHGPPLAYTRDGNLTLLPYDPRQVSLMGQRMGFSNKDVSRLAGLYGCTGHPTTSGQLLTRLVLRSESLIAPVSKDQCICQERWRAVGDGHCANEENGWCCNPDEDKYGPWCLTVGRCMGRIWDYCRPATRAKVAPETKQGCKCAPPLVPIACARKEVGYCCNPDGDPNGPWCRTESSCSGSSYDYCVPPTGNTSHRRSL